MTYFHQLVCVKSLFSSIVIVSGELRLSFNCEKVFFEKGDRVPFDSRNHLMVHRLFPKRSMVIFIQNEEMDLIFRINDHRHSTDLSNAIQSTNFLV